ncbi:MAG TPA: septal ring lytic transglycosylase RlpA family protein [Pseudolabrys sp.]|nr:septal ring lytic transglycosylase RlpA family protein [Pseudolabrys sp.]
MPIQEKSSLSRKDIALGLTRRDHGAIASAIAPLLLLFASVGAPRPAFGQSARDKAAALIALYAPEREADATDADEMAVLDFVEHRPGGGTCHRADAVPQRQALYAALTRSGRPAPALMREPLVGAASTYNPLRADEGSGGPATASGEVYDAEAWTAAIRTELRGRFGGVRYGCSYRPAYALVEGAGKRAVVKINDVGPLKPGRIIDLNERAMRFFDATLSLGLLSSVRVTPLAGEAWTPGPLPDAPTAVAADPAPPPREQVVATLN